MDQEWPRELRFAPLGQPQQIFSRDRGNNDILLEAERLSHMRRGHGEALTDTWANLYAENGFAIAARRSGVTLPKDFVRHADAVDGAAGVRFVEACADSQEVQAAWVPFRR